MPIFDVDDGSLMLIMLGTNFLGKLGKAGREMLWRDFTR